MFKCYFIDTRELWPGDDITVVVSYVVVSIIFFSVLEALPNLRERIFGNMDVLCFLL